MPQGCPAVMLLSISWGSPRRRWARLTRGADAAPLARTSRSEPAWVADAVSDAEAAKSESRATATRDKALHAADAAWVATALPAWTAYETDLTTHAADWVATAAPAWQSAVNAELAASTTFTTAAVPLAIAVDADLSANITAWLSTTASGEQTYADELADQDVAYVGVTTAAEEKFAIDLIENSKVCNHVKTELDVIYSAFLGEAVINWAGTIAGQLTSLPYTPPASILSWPGIGSSGSQGGAGTNAYGAGVGGTSETSPRNILFIYDDSEINELGEGLRQAAGDYHFNFGGDDWESVIEYVKSAAENGLIDELYIADHVTIHTPPA